MSKPTYERFWQKVNKTNNCWLWTGATCKEGYGQFKYDGKNYKAHRFVFGIVGKDLGGKQYVDHMCKTRNCVNPDHLRAVTPRVNAIENSLGNSAINAAKTHCPRGHEYDVTTAKGRRCRTCDKETTNRMRDSYRNVPRKPRPPKEVLAKEIKSNSWMDLARKYGVSDNAVRKWAKKYELI